jgi:uncharacterized membrane protein
MTLDDSRIGAAADEGADEDRSRFLAFSDGVFAIAATLLAVSLGVPILRPNQVADLPGRLLELWPAALAYAISFLVVASFWGAHRQLFKRIPRLDDALIAMNAVLLLLIAALPFPSSVLGLYASDAPIAVALYAATLTAIGLLLLSIRVYALSRNLMKRGTSPQVERTQTLRTVIYPAVFAASIPLAYTGSPTRAMYFWLLLIPLNVVLNRLPFGKPAQRTRRPSS